MILIGRGLCYKQVFVVNGYIDRVRWSFGWAMSDIFNSDKPSKFEFLHEINDLVGLFASVP